MSSLIRDQMSFTRVRSVISNRLSFRHPTKTTDVSESANAEHIKTEHGQGVTPSNTVNVVLFGETGVGKSSVINLIARREIAKVSSDVNGCTMQSTQYDIEFDNTKFAIFDTIGLEEPQMGVNGYLKAIEKAYELITKLTHAGGVHLLLFCMRGGRITATTQSNYRLFCEILCSTKVPTALVFTGLEREAEMEDWWRRNKAYIEGYGIKSDGHACITAVQDDTPGEDLKYTESQKTIRKLLKECALGNTAYSPDTLRWFARLGRDMMDLIEKRMSPKRKKVLKVLVKRCKLDPETAKKIADMMEKGDPDTKPAPPGIVEEANPPNPEAPADPGQETKDRIEDEVTWNPDTGGESSDEEGEDGRHSENGMMVISLPSGGSSPGMLVEAGQQVQGGNNEEESHSNAGSNAAGWQKSKYANKSVATPNPDNADRAGTPVSVRETGKLSDNPPNPGSVARTTSPPVRGNAKISDSATKTVSSRTVREDTRESRGEPLDASNAVSSHIVRVDLRQSREEPSPDGAGRTIPFPSDREGITHSRKEPYRDVISALNVTPLTGIGETTVQPKRVPSPGSADKNWSAVPAGENLGQTKKVSNPDNGVKTWSATGPREGSSGQFKKGSNPEVASKSGPHVGAGGSTGQPWNASSVAQPPNAVVAAQTYAGRGDSTRQSSSHR